MRLAYRCFVIAIMACGFSYAPSRAAQLSHPGSQFDIGGTLFPTYSFPQNSIVPWRSDSENNLFSIDSTIGERYYGTAGYALFGTQFSFPNANSNPPAPNAFINPNLPHPDFPDLIDLPSFVTNSQIFASRIAAGWSYALIDDPRLQAGIRHWTFDGTNYPPADGTNDTGVVPYVKLGIIDGSDPFGHNPVAQDPAQADGVAQLTYRWGFQVGANVPASFRVGVMTDGLDNEYNFNPKEVHLQQVDLGTGVPVVISSIDTGVIPDGLGLSGTEDYIPGRNRFVDLHFFDIAGAQPGDQFVFAVRGAVGAGSAGIAGFTFDVIDPTTQGVLGDYNEDGFVNAADYTVWRDHLGLAFTLPNEGPDTTPGQVTPEDYDFWKSQFVAGGGATALGVPEPGTFALVAIALAACVTRRHRR
jgi:hypothetical protein